MILTTRFITDSDQVLSAELISVSGNFATILLYGQQKKCKIYTSYDGSKYILPLGKYSMAPSLKLPSNA